MRARATVTGYGPTADAAIADLTAYLTDPAWTRWTTEGDIDTDDDGPCLSQIWRARVTVTRTVDAA